MSAVMLTATIAVPATRSKPIDYAAGHESLKTIEDPDLFRFTDDDLDDTVMEIVDKVDDADAHDELLEQCFDDDNKVTLTGLCLVAHPIIDALATALNDSIEVDCIRVADYDLYIAAGLSWGDDPDAVTAIWNAHKLPESVLIAMGFVPHCSKPLTPDNDKD